MATYIDPYNPIFIQAYLDTLSWWRSFLCNFFESQRVTKEEYLEWFYGGMPAAVLHF